MISLILQKTEDMSLFLAFSVLNFFGVGSLADFYTIVSCFIDGVPQWIHISSSVMILLWTVGFFHNTTGNWMRYFTNLFCDYPTAGVEPNMCKPFSIPVCTISYINGTMWHSNPVFLLQVHIQIYDHVSSVMIV